MVNSSFEYVLPVIRGIQAGREYYVSMCPLRLLPKLLPLEDEQIPAEMRACRTLNRHRVAEIGRYILNNPKNYIFSAITASIDAEIAFEPIGNEADYRKIGRLRVPMDARFTINDGRHRRAAFELALKENPELGYETVAVVFFLDIGLSRCQQMFADLNRYPVPLDPCLSIVYDCRDDRAKLVREVVKRVPVFRGLTEMERSTISARSGKLFSLHGIYHGTMVLMANYQGVKLEKQIDLAAGFWNRVSEFIPDWDLVLQRKVAAREVRRDFVHCHGVSLQAIGCAGARLLWFFPDAWEGRLSGLAGVDWSVSNPVFQGSVVCRGGVSNSRSSVDFLSDYVGRFLGWPVVLGGDV